MATNAYPYPSKLRLDSEAKGRAEGMARAITEVLTERGVAMEDADREQILACTDPDILGTWLHRALRVTSVGELFAD